MHVSLNAVALRELAVSETLAYHYDATEPSFNPAPHTDEFSDFIVDSNNVLNTQTNVCEHEIHLHDEKPVRQAIRRVPFEYEFKKLIDDMLLDGIIVPSESFATIHPTSLSWYILITLLYFP